MIAALNLPAPLLPGLTLRPGVEHDLDQIITLLADDDISASRGDVADPDDRPGYLAGLRRIVADPANALLVVETAKGELVGTMQLTVIPGMARRGASRMLVEAVRVAATSRSGGVGTAMMRWVIGSAAPAAGCRLIQLTSDASRIAAHRFYQRLGFVGSHLGFKYQL